MVDSFKTIVITSAACILFYLLFLGWTLVNIKRYLIDQKRYKTFSVLIFYICVVIIEVCRLLQYTNNITMYSTDKITGIWGDVFVYNFTYVIALFVKVILGFFQVLAMAELGYRVRDYDNKETRVKVIRAVVVIINLSAFFVMIWLGIELMYVSTDVTKFRL